MANAYVKSYVKTRTNISPEEDRHLDFPQLKFHIPNRRNTSTLVFVDDLSKGALLERQPPPHDADIEEDLINVGHQLLMATNF